MKTKNIAPVASMMSTGLNQLAAIRDAGLRNLRRIPLVGPPAASLLRPKIIETTNRTQRQVLNATAGKVRRAIVKTGIVR